VSKSFLSDNSPNQPVLFRLNEIKRVKQLKLISYHFEEIVPIEKNGKIKLLLTIPATVSGYLDMNELYFEIRNDTLVDVVLPQMKIDSAVFEIENAANYDLEKRFNINLGSGLYQEVFEVLKEKLKDSKKTVTAKAITMGLPQETESAAREYINLLLSDLGYAVFYRPSLNNSY